MKSFFILVIMGLIGMLVTQYGRDSTPVYHPIPSYKTPIQSLLELSDVVAQRAGDCLQTSSAPVTGSVVQTNTCNYQVTYAFCNLNPGITSSTEYQCKEQLSNYSPSGYVYQVSVGTLAPGASVTIPGSEWDTVTKIHNVTFVTACATGPIPVTPSIISFDTGRTITNVSQYLYACLH